MGHKRTGKAIPNECLDERCLWAGIHIRYDEDPLHESSGASQHHAEDDISITAHRHRLLTCLQGISEKKHR